MSKRVVILGGGIAGMSAAHELVERGFEVIVYDKHRLAGGKARSFGVPGSGKEGRRDLPTEHGFRFFPGFYRHLPDTMKRIPFAGQHNGVFDNLVQISRLEMATTTHPTVTLPIRFPMWPSDFWAMAKGGIEGASLGIPINDLAYFASRVAVLASSSDERMLKQWENVGWWDFVRADERSQEFQVFLAKGATRSLVACRAEDISVRTGGSIMLQLLADWTSPGIRNDRVLNGPTTEVWIRPWLDYLRDRGVTYYHRHEVLQIHCVDGRITGVTVRQLDPNHRRGPGGGHEYPITADYYIAALPVEVLRTLVTEELGKAEPALWRLPELNVAWMNGIQYYLKTDVPMTPGHVLYGDTPWALTSISQQQFWRNRVMEDYGNGEVGGILSVDVSDWDTPGIYAAKGKPARECSRQEVAGEVWDQIKACLNRRGATVLDDSNLFGWHLDTDIEDHDHPIDQHTRQCINREPLLINTVGSWASRPKAVTSIPNLFLASDYVRTNTILATMEGANEAARQAVNGILDASGSSAPRCEIWPLHRSPFLAPLRELDRILLAAGHRHVLESLTEGSFQEGIRQLRDLVGSERWHLVGMAEQVARVMRQFPGVDRLQPHVRARREASKPPPATSATTIRPAGERKTKIAILGGGMGSIAAAFKLSSTAELRDKYDITLYQLGWRIGGKGASGRNLEPGFGNRIEEHGFHVWFGFYDNAFHMMRECYRELARDPRLPLATLEDAFKPAHALVLFENYNGGWRQWQLVAAGNSFKPGDTSIGLRTFFWDMLSDVLDQMIQQWNWVLDGMSGTRDAASIVGSLIGGAVRLGGAIAGGLCGLIGIVEGLEHARRIASRRAKSGPGAAPDKAGSEALIRALNDSKEWLWRELVEPNLDNDELRHLFHLVDFTSTIAVGIIADELVEKGFNSANEETLIKWLERHGARASTLDGPLVKLLHDAQFCYPNGDVSKPDYAAGAALNAILRAFFTYKGALYYKMQAGMGDTVFGPFYEVLNRRGVKFKFFHAVDKLHLSRDKSVIESIDVIPQVNLRGDHYQPLTCIKGLPCWPNQPLWEQIASADSETIRSKHINLEHEPNPLNRRPITLQLGDDFDKVILGIPVAGLNSICTELVANRDKPDFKQMLDNASTTMTQAFQVWMNRTTDGLGWEAESNSIMSCYSEPMDSYSIMTHLISREDWPLRDGPLSIGYLCSVLKDEPGDNQARCNDRVKQNAIEFLTNRAAPLWPYAVQAPRTDFNWDLLHDSQARQAPARFDSQFWVANFQPTERFVLSPARQVKYRLRTDQSGYSNFFFAGDWIRTGFDVSCIESAVMSGLQAARAITGIDEPIVGEDDRWLAKAI
jgi:15-cis-phytoene desaturase